MWIWWLLPRRQLPTPRSLAWSLGAGRRRLTASPSVRTVHPPSPGVARPGKRLRRSGATATPLKAKPRKIRGEGSPSSGSFKPARMMIRSWWRWSRMASSRSRESESSSCRRFGQGCPWSATFTPSAPGSPGSGAARGSPIPCSWKERFLTRRKSAGLPSRPARERPEGTWFSTGARPRPPRGSPRRASAFTWSCAKALLPPNPSA